MVVCRVPLERRKSDIFDRFVKKKIKDISFGYYYLILTYMINYILIFLGRSSRACS